MDTVKDDRNIVLCEMGHKIGCTVCKETIYVPNWFDKIDCEDLLDENISQEQFEAFVKYANESSEIPNKISEMVRKELFKFLTNEG